MSFHVSSTSHLQQYSSFFFFNDTATTEIYTLSLHDALPISNRAELKPKDGRIQQTGIRLHETASLVFHLTGLRAKLEIGRAHVLTPVTATSRMPSSA